MAQQSATLRKAASNRVLNFVPNQLDGCQLWLRSDMGVTLDENNAVSQWNDQSGQANHVTNTTVAQRPAYAFNSLTKSVCLRFVSARTAALFRINTNLVNAGPYTMIVAHQQNSTVTGYFFGNTNSNGGSGGMAFGTNAGSRNVLHQNVANHTDGSTQTTTPEIWLATYDGSTVPVFYLNGIPTTVTGTNGMLTPAASGAIAVGSFVFGSTPSSPSDTDFFEGIIYNRQLTPPEINLIQQYMSQRYKIGVV